MKVILVIGGAGFIGSEFVRQAVKIGYRPIVVDKITYAGDLKRLQGLKGKHAFYKADICNRTAIEAIVRRKKPDVVINFAAESHVDRSIKYPAVFLETNVKGTQNLLDVTRKYKINKFIHISTDEVYGEIKKGRFSEYSPLKPNSPYAASKAAADLLINSYMRTYNFPAMVVRPCNNYGPWQYPEKLIPVIVSKAIRQQKVPVYGKGDNVREWLYVSDCAEAILKVMNKGTIGQIYNIGSDHERKNLDVVKAVLKILGKSERYVNFVEDRPGHDYRYRLNFSKIKKLGWKPKVKFEEGIKKTVNWYRENEEWLKHKSKNLRNYYFKSK